VRPQTSCAGCFALFRVIKLRAASLAAAAHQWNKG
jgi:hypothetical protein